MRIAVFAATWLSAQLLAATLEVGPGKRFAKPCAAFAAAANGDDIVIDAAGDYTRDVCNITRNNLYIRGINGRPVIDGQGTTAGNKGIWTIQGNDIIVDNIEFKNARSISRNGAGIRHEGRNLRVRNSYFHDNEDGILATSHPQSVTIIEFTEFENNGTPDGQAHNLYVNTGEKLIFRFNYSHRAIGGHLLKTRLAENHILFNRLLQENGTGSYECDLPNQGKTWLIGNILQQGNTSPNQHMVSWGTESRDRIPGSHLYAFHNTFINDSDDPKVPTEWFLAAPGTQSYPVVFGNNIIYGRGELHASNLAPLLIQNLITQSGDLFVNPEAFDYRLKEGSSAIDTGSGEYPGEVGTMVPPKFQHVPQNCGKVRPADGTPDAGALEFEPTQPAEVSATCDGSFFPETGLSMMLNGAALVGGASGSGRITVERAAPANGLSIALRSSSPEVLLPQSVFIPAGAVSAGFVFSSRPVAEAGTVKITASADAEEVFEELTLSPIGADALRLAPATTGGGSTSVGTVVLNAPAPPGGFIVRLSSSNPAVAEVPAQASVNQGSNQGTFNIKTNPVPQETAAIITAMSPTGDRTATLTVQPVGILNLVPASLRFGGGSTVTMRINFSGPTPATPNSVEFSSSDPAVIPAPSPLAVGAGVTFSTVPLRSLSVSSSATVTITAVFNQTSRATVILTVDPPSLASITSTLTTFGSGGNIRMTVSLNAPFAGSVPLPVTLASQDPSLVVIPGSVSIPPGATSVSFEAQTNLVRARTPVIVTALSNQVSRTITLNLDPMAVTGFTCPTSAKGGTTITCRPTINGPAAVGGTKVELSTSAPTVAGVPADMLIATGQTTGSVLIQTRAVPISSTLSISASLGGVTRTVNVTLTP